MLCDRILAWTVTASTIFDELAQELTDCIVGECPLSWHFCSTCVSRFGCLVVGGDCCSGNRCFRAETTTALLSVSRIGLPPCATHTDQQRHLVVIPCKRPEMVEPSWEAAYCRMHVHWLPVLLHGSHGMGPNVTASAGGFLSLHGKDFFWLLVISLM